jgi:hypothetical protein
MQQSVNTKLQQHAGKIKKYNKNITCTRGRGTFLRGWSKQQPGYHDRTIMMKKCGKKCFLGTRKTFPICTRNTCKINRKGVYSAFIRAREYSTIRGSQNYNRIAVNARRLLRKTNRKCR